MENETRKTEIIIRYIVSVSRLYATLFTVHRGSPQIRETIHLIVFINQIHGDLFRFSAFRFSAYLSLLLFRCVRVALVPSTTVSNNIISILNFCVLRNLCVTRANRNCNNNNLSKFTYAKCRKAKREQGTLTGQLLCDDARINTNTLHVCEWM